MKALKNQNSLIFSSKIVLSAIVISQSLVCATFADAKPLYDHEEAFVKRVYQFYREGENAIVKKQITDFLAKHPNCSFQSQLEAILGDINAQEGLFEEAKKSYSNISDTSIYNKVALNHFRCLSHLKQWNEILEKAPKLIESQNTLTSEKKVELAKIYAFAGFNTLDDTQDVDEKKEQAIALVAHINAFPSDIKHEVITFTLAKSYSILEEHDKASSMFLELANQSPEKAEEYLFSAATSQSVFDKVAAKNTFKKVRELNKDLYSKAFYNEVLITFDLGQYEEVIAYKSSFESYSGKDKSFLMYLCGVSEYKKGFMEESYITLNSLPVTEFNTNDVRTIGLTLTDIALKLQNQEYFESSFTKLHSEIGNEPVIADILSFHAHQCLENKDSLHALTSLKKLIAYFPEHDNMEATYFDYACAEYLQGHWVEAHNAFTSFNNRFPNSSRKESSWKFLLNTSCQMAKEPSFKGTPQMYELLCTDIKDLFASGVTLDENEQLLYSFTLAKSLYEKGDKAEAFEHFYSFIEKYPSSPHSHEACYMMGLSAGNSLEDLSSVLSKTEEMLSRSQSSEDQLRLNLQAYNASLELSKTNPSLFTPIAAKHLYFALAQDKDAVKMDNQRWLANYLYTSLDPSSPDYLSDIQKASFVLEKILFKDDQGMSLNVEQLNSDIEVETLKLADLYDKQENYEQKALLLENLLKIQKEISSDWSHVSTATYSLAKAYSQLGKHEKAIETYSSLISSSDPFSSYYSVASLLEHTRLKYKMMESTFTDESSDEFLDVIGCLKDLQINRRLQTEPCHIEAALDYVDIRSKMLRSDDTEEKKILFLERIKEDFSSQTEDSDEKTRLVHSYLQYVDAEIKRLRSIEMKKQDNIEAAASLEKEAKESLDGLLNRSDAVTSYLRNKVEASYSKLSSNS